MENKSVNGNENGHSTVSIITPASVENNSAPSATDKTNDIEWKCDTWYGILDEPQYGIFISLNLIFITCLEHKVVEISIVICHDK